MTNRTRAPAGDPRRWCRAVALVFCMALAPLIGADAQLIPIKTVPLADGDQFGFLPSANLGMGSVSIALADTLLDPFSNPAKAARLRRGRFYGSPTFYSVSRNTGSGRTLPLGTIVRSSTSFAGFAVALQEINPAGPENDIIDQPIPLDFAGGPSPLAATSNAQPHSNKYVSAMFGRIVPSAGLSIGASVFWSGLGAVDGTDLLYPGSNSVRQSGDALDFRFGLLKEWNGDRSLEAVIVHNRFGVSHDVSFLEFMWDPLQRQPVQRTREEHHLDRTRTTGLHLEYERPLADSGWRIGGLLTANRTSHPELPDYPFADIPRDAGHSSAFNMGVGFAKVDGPASVGVDVIYEPIWSRTGDASVDNRFRFANSIIRAGLSRDFNLMRPADELSPTRSFLRLQVGAQLRSVNYSLDQRDRLGSATRSQAKSWKEWSRTVGATLHLPEFEIHYRLRSTSGAGRPMTAAPDFWRGGFGTTADLSIAPFPGPIASSSLEPVRVKTQQVSVSVPIR
jgi:hypothetical protein